MLEPVGPCPGFEGYGACHEDVGGNCCPGYYACLNDGCFFTQKLQIGAVTATLTQSGSTVIATFDKNGPSAATSLARLKTSASDRPGTTSDTTPDPANATIAPAPSGLSQGALIGISVSAALVVLFIAIGVYFMIRRRRKRGIHKSAESAVADDDKQGPNEIEPEIQAKKGLSLNDRLPSELPTDNEVAEVSSHDIAWELENTQYTPELSAPHGMSEMETRGKANVRVGPADFATGES
ncbi:hypothetical protein QBC40DRAFT_207240 [Triangularia verruculosa]|uniref:Uncharacterized protein n=1 Tax=Triangularia verruculosa TaxID=2587418 RepID=A0AAN7ASE1_9PEZI|nr:hypothetical protein QBC40DRAFT_207240 [Triangularia verruculosa]